MPIYEFRCGSCGAGIEALVDVGTETIECTECGANRAPRVYSPQAAPLNLVKPRGEIRKQERRNAQLREATKARFKDARARARAQRTGRSGGKR